MLRLLSSDGKISFGWLVPQFWGATGGQLPGGPTESMRGSYESARYSTSLGQAGSAMEPSFFFLRIGDADAGGATQRTRASESSYSE